MAVDAANPIGLLAPTTVASSSEGGSVIVEMTAAAFKAVADAVTVAFEMPPAGYDPILAGRIWRFFNADQVPA